jgi:hypothetical protein
MKLWRHFSPIIWLHVTIVLVSVLHASIGLDFAFEPGSSEHNLFALDVVFQLGLFLGAIFIIGRSILSGRQRQVKHWTPVRNKLVIFTSVVIVLQLVWVFHYSALAINTWDRKPKRNANHYDRRNDATYAPLASIKRLNLQNLQNLSMALVDDGPQTLLDNPSRYCVNPGNATSASQGRPQVIMLTWLISSTVLHECFVRQLLIFLMVGMFYSTIDYTSSYKRGLAERLASRNPDPSPATVEDAGLAARSLTEANVQPSNDYRLAQRVFSRARLPSTVHALTVFVPSDRAMESLPAHVLLNLLSNRASATLFALRHSVIDHEFELRPGDIYVLKRECDEQSVPIWFSCPTTVDANEHNRTTQPARVCAAGVELSFDSPSLDYENVIGVSGSVSGTTRFYGIDRLLIHDRADDYELSSTRSSSGSVDVRFAPTLRPISLCIGIASTILAIFPTATSVNSWFQSFGSDELDVVKFISSVVAPLIQVYYWHMSLAMLHLLALLIDHWRFPIQAYAFLLYAIDAGQDGSDEESPKALSDHIVASFQNTFPKRQHQPMFSVVYFTDPTSASAVGLNWLMQTL